MSVAAAIDQLTPLLAYRRMLIIRRFEERCLELSTSTPPAMAGSLHFCAGQEAIPVGAMAALTGDDRVVATYRGHGWALERGVGVDELLAECLHRASGINGGRAGSPYVMAPWLGFIGENSIVGAGVPIAAGCALASVFLGTGRIAVVSFGDGAVNQGALHEGIAFAAARRLPVVLVCENNGWSEMTPISETVPFPRLADRASGLRHSGGDGRRLRSIRGPRRDRRSRCARPTGRGPELRRVRRRAPDGALQPGHRALPPRRRPRGCTRT